MVPKLGNTRGKVLAGASIIALALASAAEARVIVRVDSVLSGSLIAGDIFTAPVEYPANLIDSSLGSANSTLNATITSATTSQMVEDLGDSAGSVSFDSNSIFAVARGTANLNRIGVIDTSASGNPDGVGIFAAGRTENVTLSASVTASTLISLISGSGDADLGQSFDGNSIIAEGSFNRAANTIEVASPSGLANVAPGAGYIDGDVGALEPDFPNTTVLTAASIDITNVQENVGFGSGDLFESTAEIDDNTILLDRSVQPPGPFGGSYGLTNNSIAAQANGNTSDNSVFIRGSVEYVDDNGTPDDTSDDTVETIQGSTTFDGNVVVANAQRSVQTVPFSGIIASNETSSITADFVRGDQSSQSSASDFSVDVSGNGIDSTARINASRNEVTVDGGINIAGSWADAALPDYAAGIVSLDEAKGSLVASADLLSVNRQFALGPVAQTAVAWTDEATVALFVEDVDGTSSLALDDNAIRSVASGNSHSSLLGNATPSAAEGSLASVTAVIASANYQYIQLPQILALTDDSSIVVEVGVQDSTGDGIGGFENSALSFVGNAISSSASGNTGSSLIAVEANTFDNEYTTRYSNFGYYENSGTFLSSDRGYDFPNGDRWQYDASAGTAIFNHQVLDNTSEGNYSIGPDIVAVTIDSELRVQVNGPAGQFVPDVVDSLSGSVDVSSNSIQASAIGNEFSSLIDHNAVSYSGSVGTMSVQSNTAQNIGALLGFSDLIVTLGVDADVEVVTDLSVVVDDNRLIAQATGNRTSNAILVEANTFDGGAWGGEYDFGNPARRSAGGIWATTLNATQELTTSFAFLNASAGILTDQLLSEADVGAASLGNDIEVRLGVGSDDLVLSGAVSVSDNTLGAQVRGNEASNALLLAVELTATSQSTTQEPDDGEDPPAEPPSVPPYGPLAGIVSSQVIANFSGAPTDDWAEGWGVVVGALVEGNDILVEMPDLLNASVDVSGNRIIANAAGNLITNELVVLAGTLDVTSSGDASSFIEENTLGNADLTVESPIFILNNQRNERQDPEIGTELRGGTIRATLGDDFDNSIEVNVGAIENGSVKVDNNLLQASASANGAVNSIIVGMNTGNVGADILNRQGNSGDVLATNEDSSISLTLNGIALLDEPANVGASASLKGNTIGSSASSNTVQNEISASAAAGFQTVLVNSSAELSQPPNNGNQVDFNGNQEAHGGLVVLNSQRTYGFAENEVQISATTSGATISLNAPGGVDGGTVGVQNNRITASAIGNSATNIITASAGVGGLPSATISNSQSVNYADISATVTSATITGGVGSPGLTGSGSYVVSGNSIGASAVGNSAVNTISAPGQSFTRGNSF